LTRPLTSTNERGATLLGTPTPTVAVRVKLKSPIPSVWANISRRPFSPPSKVPCRALRAADWPASQAPGTRRAEDLDWIDASNAARKSLFNDNYFSSYPSTPLQYPFAVRFGVRFQDPVFPPDLRSNNPCFGLSRRTIDNWLQRGMPHLKLGARRVRFDLCEIEAWLQRECRTVRYGKSR
jgi:hypothetical protein